MNVEFDFEKVEDVMRQASLSLMCESRPEEPIHVVKLPIRTIDHLHVVLQRERATYKKEELPYITDSFVDLPNLTDHLGDVLRADMGMNDGFVIIKSSEERYISMLVIAGRSPMSEIDREQLSRASRALSKEIEKQKPKRSNQFRKKAPHSAFFDLRF